MNDVKYAMEPIGVIRSDLFDLAKAPLQGDEGGCEGWLELLPQFADGLAGIHIGDVVIVLTWLHRAHREVLQVHPRGRLNAPLTGVFATRSPDRPNPIGLHQVSVLQIEGHSLLAFTSVSYVFFAAACARSCFTLNFTILVIKA
jgi:tRNA-Thr(GGU) m(6)t(6)A37 methyltransferase TsaA